MTKIRCGNCHSTNIKPVAVEVMHPSSEVHIIPYKENGDNRYIVTDDDQQRNLKKTWCPNCGHVDTWA